MAVLVVKHWKNKFVGAPGVRLMLRSDSVVALAMTDKLAATPAINWVAAELALLLEEIQVESVKVGHIRGAINICADYLSRINSPEGPGVKPPVLSRSMPYPLPGTSQGIGELGRRLRGTSCVGRT